MTDQPAARFDPRAFRRALGNFATGVTIMTAAVEGRRVGVTANSFNSVSLEPALILWSIDKRSTSYGVFDAASHFAVNVLAADQIELSNQFARPSDDKFATVEIEEGAGGAPLFGDCAARFQCELYQQIDGGDHWILIGKVVAFDDFGRAPLLYHQGAYSSVLPHPRAALKKAGEVASSFQGRLGENLYYLMTQAVRSYQSDYQPRQLATGLRTSEARLLMVLEHDACLGMEALQELVGVPVREIDEALNTLKRRAFVNDQDGRYSLTPLGGEQAEVLWHIAQAQQDKVFADCSVQQIEAFKQVLKKVIALA